MSGCPQGWRPAGQVYRPVGVERWVGLFLRALPGACRPMALPNIDGEI
jgi:hypothetical protein